MSLINEPSPLAFADNLPLPTPENIMNPVQRYWYNRGHEDGRKLASVKELTDEEIEEVIRKHWNREYGNRNMLTLCKAVLKEASK